MSAAWSEATTPDRDEIVHVLNRVSFGPGAGEIEAVEKMGLNQYLQQQLHPETIDDSAVEQEVAQLELLQLSPPQLAQLYELERKESKDLQQKRLQNGQATGAGPTMSPQDRRTAMSEMADQNRSFAAISQLAQAKLIRAVASRRQLQEVLVDFWSNHFNIDFKKGFDRVLKIVDDREVIRPHLWGKFRDLLEASAKSPAMLFYLDNASNTVAAEVSPQQQQTRALFLQKVGLTPPVDPATPLAQLQTQKEGGINENYARELMELHTLGVDGGYTQQDVQEVARCFTGWSFDRQTGAFVFRAFQHDDGAKVVLGHKIPAGGGQQDGETVLDLLCSDPACAHHIALEMVQRFVSDAPSPELVARIADVFTRTGGDLRAVTQAILASPEFLSPSSYGNKIKSPLEFAVSAVRATGSTLLPKQPPPLDRIVPAMEGAGVAGRGQASTRLDASKRQSLNWHLVELGEPLFACTPPTGYTEVSTSWVNPGALIERLNFATALTGQEISDVHFDAQKLLPGMDLHQPEAVLDRYVAVLLPNKISEPNRQVLEQAALSGSQANKGIDPSNLIALIIGSPEFQRK